MEKQNDPCIKYALAMEHQKNNIFETTGNYSQVIEELFVLKQQTDFNSYSELKEAYKNFKMNIN